MGSLSGQSMRNLLLSAPVIAAIGGAMIEAVSPVLARDLDGRATGSRDAQWFENLASRRGPCCSDADGVTVEDTHWDFKEGHYRVYLKDL